MASRSIRLVARLLWFAPALLLVLTLFQARDALSLRQTWQEGTPAKAVITHYQNEQRYDVTFVAVDLEVIMPDGSSFTREKMSLPTPLRSRIEDVDTVEVHVRSEAGAQNVVIDRMMPAQWLATAGQAGMALMGALLLGFGVWWWNRYLKRQGDPGRKAYEDAEPVRRREA